MRTLVRPATLTLARNALPGWDVAPSTKHPEQMTFSRLTGPEKVSGVVFDAPSVPVALRAARLVSEVG